MRLNIPEHKAIEFLQNRIRELDSFNFQPKAWKSKTENDLKEIFSVGDTKWLQISGINFNTLVDSKKAEVLREGKAQAKQLLESYVELIKNYSAIQQEKEVIEEDNFKKKYSDLLEEWNGLVPNYNTLLKEKETLNETLETKDQELSNKDQEIQRVIENTVQLSNISLTKLIKLLFSLPVGQVIAFFAILIAIIGGSFQLGKLYSDSISKNDQFEIKTENTELKKSLETLKNEKKNMQNAFEESKLLIDSLRNGN